LAAKIKSNAAWLPQTQQGIVTSSPAQSFGNAISRIFTMLNLIFQYKVVFHF
jgi:hypothetical protein